MHCEQHLRLPDRECGQQVGLTRWFDTSGREHVACPRHVRGMKSRWVPEAAIPGVYVSEAEAWALWGMTARESYKRDGAHTHFDERDANLADCPACERAEARA